MGGPPSERVRSSARFDASRGLTVAFLADPARVERNATGALSRSSNRRGREVERMRGPSGRRKNDRGRYVRIRTGGPAMAIAAHRSRVSFLLGPRLGGGNGARRA